MKPSPKRIARAESFPGLVTNADPYDIPFGATTIQDNIQCISPGQIEVRKGWLRASGFNRPIPSEAMPDLTNLYRYRHPSGDRIITVTKSGAIESRASGAVTAVSTNQYGDTCWSFARERCGALLGINGYGRGIYWDGASAAQEKLGLDPPTIAPAITLSATAGANGLTSIGNYICYYRYAAGPPGRYHYSNLSPATVVPAAAGDIGKSMSWSSLQQSAQPRVHTIELFRSLPGDENRLYMVGTIPVGLKVSTMSGTQTNNLLVNFLSLHNLSVNRKISIASSAGDDGISSVTSVVDPYTVITDGVWSGNQTAVGTARVGTVGLTESYSDTQLQDMVLADPAKMLLITSGGELVANRFVPPPEWKHSVAKFQDRMFYGADTLLSTGTVATVAFNKTVTISQASSLPSSLEFLVGRSMWISGEANPFVIIGHGTNTVTVNPTPSTTAINRSYVIRPAECERNAIYYSEPDEPQSVPRTNVITIQEQAQDEDEIVGVHSFGAYLYVLKEHHLYTLSFIRQPRIDAQARLLLHRGAFNKNCWDSYEGRVYIMDSSGCYSISTYSGAYDGGGFVPISDPIQNLWRDGTIDITNTKWFHVRVDSHSAVVRFYVRYVGDLGERPRRALCFNIRTNAWWTESYPMEVSQADSIDLAGVRVNLGASQNDTVVNLAAGNSDMVTQEIRGTVETATAELIADSKTVFNSSMLGAPIAFINENGMGQVRTIVDIVSPHVIKINPGGNAIVNFDQGPLNPIPISGSQYIIGGINFRARFGASSMVEDDDQHRRSWLMKFTPTEKQYYYWVRRYWDHSESAEPNWHSQDLGNNVFTIQGTTESWVDIKREPSVRGGTAGIARVMFSGKKEETTQWHARLSIEVEGIKGDEPMIINEVRLEGSE
jgi:hypothetical protein